LNSLIREEEKKRNSINFTEAEKKKRKCYICCLDLKYKSFDQVAKRENLAKIR